MLYMSRESWGWKPGMKQSDDELDKVGDDATAADDDDDDDDEDEDDDVEVDAVEGGVAATVFGQKEPNTPASLLPAASFSALDLLETVLSSPTDWRRRRGDEDATFFRWS